MAKALNVSGAGAVRTILKYKQDFNFDLRDETVDGNTISRTYDVFYLNSTGTFHIVTVDGKVVVAALNLSLGKVINLTNDTNLRKLADYVIANTK